jgi:diguanylate cyclase (GGDEF)-like protein
MLAFSVKTQNWVSTACRHATVCAIVAAVVFAGSMFGILTRPVGFLAAFWPANAILLGLMTRNPQYATVAGWAGAFAGYMIADLATGGEPGVTLWLTAANMAGAMTGFLLFQVMSEEDRRLRRPLSVLYLFAVCAIASLVAALIGGGVARLLFGRDFVAGLEFWFVTELVNNLVILPVMLTFPGLAAFSFDAQRRSGFWLKGARHAFPALALLAAVGVGMVVGGPGALAFPVPGLIWCALSYSMFITAVVTMLLCGWLMIAVSSSLLLLPMMSDAIASTTSVRLGVALIALGPLTVASINTARNELLARLFRAANHDSLTGTLSRSAFLTFMNDAIRTRKPAALLMLDVDHFKRVNDGYGHAGGDRALVELARLVGSQLRQGDAFGRIGGEEFAVMLPDTDVAEAKSIAERIHGAVREADIQMTPSVSARISVSIGVAVHDGTSRVSPESLMAAADQALYVAKSAGRDQVRIAD